jgi:glutamate N-acetyltransferase/amino-acid N-acetyltransferase
VVVSAAGAFDPDRLDIFLDHRPVVSKGAALHVGTAMLRSLLAKPRVEVRVDLHTGRARALMVTCDLTEAYVRINAGYAT